jgi:hypothetical protein
MANGGGGDGNQNYANASATAQPPVGNQQIVSVSCSVLAPSQGVQAWLTQTQESGEAESVLVLQLNLQGGTGNNPTWIPVAFNGNVELQDGNPITQVEILSDMLGNLTIELGSGQSSAVAPAGGTPPAPTCAPDAASGDGNQNYANASASAQPPVGNQQVVAVSCSVLAPRQGMEAWLSQTQESGEAESVLVLQLNLQGGTGNNPTWVPVAFNGSVQLQDGNAITQVEILSDTLGDLTIGVAAGRRRSGAAVGGSPAARGAPAARAVSGTSNPNFPFVKFMTHSAPGDLQMQVVYGEVMVANPGIQPVLRQISPPGTAPNVLALQLELVQRPGQWPQQEYRAWFHYGVAALIMRYQRPATELLILGGPLGNVTVAAQDV